MYKFKIWPGLDTATNYEVNLNKICRTESFRSYVSAANRICPNDLTVSCYENDDNILEFIPAIKHYGYDHMCNNGTEYSDMGDYVNGPEVSPELADIVFNYFKEYEPVIYDVMLKNRICK